MLSVGADPAPKSKADPQVTVRLPVPSCLMRNRITCPSTGLAGFAIVPVLAVKVRLKAFPSAALTAIEVPNVSVTASGAMYPVSVPPAVGAAPLLAAVTRPSAPTVTLALVYEPAVTAVVAIVGLG